MVSTPRIKTTAPDNTVLVEAWIVPSEAGFLNALVEGYEGLAVMRTLDRKAGHLKFWVPAGRLDFLRQVFDDFIARGWMTRYEVIEPWWEAAELEATEPPPGRVGDSPGGCGRGFDTPLGAGW